MSWVVIGLTRDSSQFKSSEGINPLSPGVLLGVLEVGLVETLDRVGEEHESGGKMVLVDTSICLTACASGVEETSSILKGKRVF